MKQFAGVALVIGCRERLSTTRTPLCRGGKKGGHSGLVEDSIGLEQNH